MSQDEATAIWKTWEADPLGSGLMFDYKGKGNKLQMRVPIATFVNFKSQISNEKYLQLQAQGIKHPGADFIRTQTRRTLMEHGRLAGEDVDMQGPQAAHDAG